MRPFYRSCLPSKSSRPYSSGFMGCAIFRITCCPSFDHGTAGNSLSSSKCWTSFRRSKSVMVVDDLLGFWTFLFDSFPAPWHAHYWRLGNRNDCAISYWTANQFLLSSRGGLFHRLASTPPCWYNKKFQCHYETCSTPSCHGDVGRNSF